MAGPFDVGKMGQLFRQAQAMRERLEALQQEVGARVVEASAGGGMVTARVNGKLEVLGVAIDPQVFEGGDREMLQDLIVAALNEALRRAQEMMASEVAKLTGGLSLPGGGR